MFIEHIKAPNLTTENWSGGKTTQLYIFPNEANYKKQNFAYRISTATVEQEKSDFSVLPNYKRSLLILEGEITINHDNKFSKKLKKFEIHKFDGSQITSSVGKCTDFNIMTDKNFSAEIFISENKAKNPTMIILSEKIHKSFLYIFEGKIETKYNLKTISAQKGDLLIINESTDTQLITNNITNSTIIITNIYKNS